MGPNTYSQGIWKTRDLGIIYSLRISWDPPKKTGVDLVFSRVLLDLQSLPGT